MKVGIDISQMAYPGTGVAVYTKNLVANLLRLGGNYVLFGSSLRKRKEFAVFPQTKVLPIPPTLLEIFWNKLRIPSVEKLIGKIDVFHSSDWTQPPTAAKKVTTIHDLVAYKYPETLQQSIGFRWGNFSPMANIVAAQKRRLALVKKECDEIIAVSESTKKDIIEILGIPEGKIKVIYEASDLKKNRETKYKFDKPYILAIGTREPRKNLDRLVQAYQKLKNRDVDLVIAGQYGWGNDVKEAKLLGYVSQEDIAGLLTNAAVFIYPSLYEGFGIPILEAFNCDCPVVTSNVSSMPEVGGKAAIYVDPENTDDIAEKIDWVLSLSVTRREELVRAGREQTKKFSWEKTAKETINVYSKALVA